MRIQKINTSPFASNGSTL